MRFIVQGLFAMFIMLWLAVIIADTPAGAVDAETARYNATDAPAWLVDPLTLSNQGHP